MRMLLPILWLTVLPCAALPLLDGLGPHQRPVRTSSPQAQRYFDQGLNLIYAFHHGAARQSFQEAARLDPQCAMAHWGVALTCGPHINAPVVSEADTRLALQALKRARACPSSPVEQALIAAQGKRFGGTARSQLDEAYAAAMRGVHARFPRDPDVGALFAEAMMDLRPWDQWTPEGQPQPGTEEILATLDDVLRLELQHPFANHLYIHATEASPHPERGAAAADRLRDLQPALAHNLHMPSHVDIRLGHWHEAVEANRKAVAADRAFQDKMGASNDFARMYAAHNHHMLAYAAMMTGQSRLALEEIRAMAAGLPDAFLRRYADVAEGYLGMQYEVLLRFGRWEDVLAEPEPPAYQRATRAFRLAARAVARAARGETVAARQEQEACLREVQAVPASSLIGNNPARAILGVATALVEGEILAAEGKIDESVRFLRLAAQQEDELHYDEPPGWILPARHPLGAVLMSAGRFAEAEAVYREDLRRLPANGWSLFGLADSLRKQGKPCDDSDFRKVWERADVRLTSSCFCRP